MTERTAPRYKTTNWRGHDNYECTLCPFATLEKPRIVEHVNRAHPLKSQAEKPLLGFGAIPFASDTARELAIELAGTVGLTPDVLERSKPSGAGGYTVADVRSAAGTLKKESDDA
jgi:hypothetical protein